MSNSHPASSHAGSLVPGTSQDKITISGSDSSPSFTRDSGSYDIHVGSAKVTISAIARHGKTLTMQATHIPSTVSTSKVSQSFNIGCWSIDNNENMVTYEPISNFTSHRVSATTATFSFTDPTSSGTSSCGPGSGPGSIASTTSDSTGTSVAMDPPVSVGGDTSSFPWSGLGVTAGSGLVCVTALAAGVATKRRRRRALQAQTSEPAEVFDTQRHHQLQMRLDGLYDRWLAYDRDLELLLTRPAMRNYGVAQTAQCVAFMQAARTACDQAKTNDDLDACTNAIREFRLALAEAEAFAEHDALMAMSDKERTKVTQAQMALKKALDGGATEPERRSAYRRVVALLEYLNVDLPPQANHAVLAQIEASQPQAQLESSEHLRQAQAIVDGYATLPATPSARRAYVESRARRRGEDVIHRLTSLTKRIQQDVHSDALPATLALDHAELVKLADELRDVQQELTDLVHHPVSSQDLRDAAQARLPEVSNSLTLIDQNLHALGLARANTQATRVLDSVGA